MNANIQSAAALDSESGGASQAGSFEPSAIHVVTLTTNPALDLTVRVDGLEMGSVNRLDSTRTDAGGKGVNVAMRLADYGCSVIATGFLGRDNPHIFEQSFAEKGVRDAFVRVAGQTRTNVKIMDTHNRQTTDLNATGLEPSVEQVEQLKQTLQHLPTGQDWYVIGGQLQAGVTERLYADLIQVIHARASTEQTATLSNESSNLGQATSGIHSVPLGLMRNRFPCIVVDTGGAALLHALHAGANIIKPNIHELSELLGVELDEDSPIQKVWSAAKQLLNDATWLIVVSMGVRGALFATQEQALVARPPKIEVQSTVGAGDAMVAGIVAGLGQGMDLATCAQFASAFSINAITQLRRDLVSRTQLALWQAQVQIEPVFELNGTV